jgi:putative transposase
VRRQLVYKLAWHGGTLVVADRFFASSKLCSSCGAVKAKLRLDERTYCCEHCGLVIDRDLNAALNLAAYGRRALSVAGSGPETRNARGGAHRRLRSDAPVKREDGTVEPDKTVSAPSQGEAA